MHSACDKILILCTAADVGIYGLLASQSCYHSMLVLVSLHCGPVVDFTTLHVHPFDFDRNLFNFLVCVLFFFVGEVLFNIMHLLCCLCFHHWFSFPVVDGFSLLLRILNFWLKIIVMLYIVGI